MNCYNRDFKKVGRVRGLERGMSKGRDMGFMDIWMLIKVKRRDREIVG